MKAYTDITQSKKLAEILSPENADMCYPYNRHLNEMYGDIPYVMGYKKFNKDTDIPCWSLVALLDVIKDYTLQTNTDRSVFVVCEGKKPIISDFYNNPVDACVEIIVKLKELNLI